jgi:hypothetical protein
MATTDEELKKLIEKISLEKVAGGIECPKDFKCTRVSFEDLCKADDIGQEGCLECLERESCDCPFMIDIGYARLCRCPLRVYIAKNLNK